MSSAAFPMIPGGSAESTLITPLHAWRRLRCERLRREQVLADNAFFRRVAPLEVSLPHDAGTIDLAVAGTPVSPTALTLTIDGRVSRLEVETALLDALMAALDAALDWRSLPDELRGMLLELAIEPWLDQLEAMLGRRIGITGVAREPSPPSGCLPLSCRIALGASVGFAWLWLDPVDRAALANLWRQRPLAPAPLADLRLRVGFRIGRTTLSLREVQSLGLGDVLLVEATYLPQPVLAVAVGASVVVPGLLEDGKVRALEPPTRVGAIDGVMRAMMDDQLPEPASDTDGTLDELPLRIVFELGRLELSLGELRSVAPGYVFELGRDLTSPVEIRCGDRRIGFGELVQVDEQVGVRIVRLFDRG